MSTARGPGRGAGPFSSLPADPETNRFGRRALERVQRSESWQTLNKTERRYATVLIGQLANQGGEMYFKHDQLAELVGQSRRNVIRVLEALVDKGLLTVGARYRWVLKVSSRGRPYRMKMRLSNVYRVATRFMTALKQAGQLIRRRNVTAEKPPLRSGGSRSSWSHLKVCLTCRRCDGQHHFYCSGGPVWPVDAPPPSRGGATPDRSPGRIPEGGQVAARRDPASRLVEDSGSSSGWFTGPKSISPPELRKFSAPTIPEPAAKRLTRVDYGRWVEVAT